MTEPMTYNLTMPQDYQGRRKQWEIETALKTLRDLGAVRPDAEILGVGAGKEPTIFILSNEVRWVFATDLYANAGQWDKAAPPDMLIDPALCAPYTMISTDRVAIHPFDNRRIIAQHMDMRSLRYPDNTFDGVFSSSSIEHVGTFADVARAAREIGRVLKPGGVCSLSTEFKLAGEGDGWPGVLLFTPEKLRQYIIEPSGLELVDTPVWLLEAVNPQSVERMIGGYNPPTETACWSETHHFVFTSVHLAMRKPA